MVPVYNILLHNISERSFSMSILIRTIVVILLVLLAIITGLLIFVCWALAVSSNRRDHYLKDKDYRVK